MQAPLTIGAGLSTDDDSASAAARAAEQAAALLARPNAEVHADVVFIFHSPSHSPHAAEIASVIRRGLSARVVIGCSACGVVGGPRELETGPGLAVLALASPGARLVTFTDADLPTLPEEPTRESTQALAAAIGAAPDLAATFVFADPFSVPMVRLLPALNASRRPNQGGRPAGTILGGVASAAPSPGGNRLILNGDVRDRGLVGVSIAGHLRVDAVVSQGCRPVGQPLVVTRAKGNVILELAGRPALDIVRETVAALPRPHTEGHGPALLVGLVINEYRERFGRSDFVVRSILGVDHDHGALAIGDLVRVGQTVQFHVRDADTASRDLGMLLDVQRMYDPPAGAMLITCNGRGSRLFGAPGHDAATLARAFLGPAPGERLAKTGHELDPTHAGLPIAGFFAAGEIGPLGADSYLQGHTAVAALFRSTA